MHNLLKGLLFRSQLAFLADDRFLDLSRVTHEFRDRRFKGSRKFGKGAVSNCLRKGPLHRAGIRHGSGNFNGVHGPDEAGENRSGKKAIDGGSD